MGLGRQKLEDVTPEQRTKLLNSLRAGGSVVLACQYSGVARGDYYTWLKQGRMETSGLYFEFVREVEKTQAAREVELCLRIEELSRRTDPKKAGGDPRTAFLAMVWSLKHIGPNRKKYQDHVEITGKDDGPIEIDIRSEWGSLREVVLNALAPFPEARAAVVKALVEHQSAVVGGQDAE